MCSFVKEIVQKRKNEWLALSNEITHVKFGLFKLGDSRETNNAHMRHSILYPTLSNGTYNMTRLLAVVAKLLLLGLIAFTRDMAKALV